MLWRWIGGGTATPTGDLGIWPVIVEIREE